MTMLLQDKTILIVGGSGAIGAAAAKVFAREGARLVLVARNAERLERAADKVRALGAKVETFEADTLDPAALEATMAAAADRVGPIDVLVNATSFLHDQGRFIDSLQLDDFMRPVETFLPALFNSCKAVLPHMDSARGGVILTLSTPAGRTATAGHLGYTVTCAGVEAFSRVLAAELGPRNIRVVCLAPHAIADAPAAGSYTALLFAPKAAAMGLSVDDWLAGAAQSTMLGRLPTLDDVAETAAFIVSDRARPMTASYVNLTAGAIPE